MVLSKEAVAELRKGIEESLEELHSNGLPHLDQFFQYNLNYIETIESGWSEIENLKAINNVLKSQNDRYWNALLNLCDYVLQGEYRTETLKILGLLEEEESE